MENLILPDKRKTPQAREPRFTMSSVEIKMFLQMYSESKDPYISEHRKKYGSKTELKFKSMLDFANQKVNSNCVVSMRPVND